MRLTRCVVQPRVERSILDTFDQVNGAKTLVLDSMLAGPLGLVTEVALLKAWAYLGNGCRS